MTNLKQLQKELKNSVKRCNDLRDRIKEIELNRRIGIPDLIVESEDWNRIKRGKENGNKKNKIPM